MTEVVTFSALFAPNISCLVLAHEPRGDKEAPDFINWSRLTTPAQLLRMAGEKCRVQVQSTPEP